jgi:hypothetical protein
VSLFDYESRDQSMIGHRHFVGRLTRSALAALCIVVVSLGIGVLGYQRLGEMTWVDAFLNASMILSGMGPVGNLPNDGVKVFASFYALFSGIVIVFSTTILLAPVVHRFLHRFHVGDAE